MKIFIDCEYNGFKGELISMALCAEDGEEFYEVLDCEFPTCWVRENVMPVLNKEAITLDVFQDKLILFLNNYLSINIIADWPEDIAHFCGALITSPGKCMNIPPFTMQVAWIGSDSKIPHNALEDARAIRLEGISPINSYLIKEN